MLETLRNFWFSNWEQIVRILAVMILGLFVIKIIVAVIRRIFRKTHLEKIVKSFILSIIKVVLVLIYFIAILSLLGVPTTSLIAILSAAGLAISLALQQSLSNLASGLIIITSKPFIEGDYVEIGASSGSVEKITLIHTILKTPDNKKIVIPNGTVTTSNLVNYSTNTTRRLDIVVSVAHGTDIELVKRVIRKIADEHEMVLGDPSPFVRLSATTGYSLDFALRVWVNRENYWSVNFDLRENIVKALYENHLEIPSNKLDVSIIK